MRSKKQSSGRDKQVKQDDFSGADVQMLEEQERSRREGLAAALKQDVEETVGGAPLGARVKHDTASAALAQQQQQKQQQQQQHSHAQGTLETLFSGRSGESWILGAPDIDKLGKVGSRPTS